MNVNKERKNFSKKRRYNNNYEQQNEQTLNQTPLSSVSNNSANLVLNSSSYNSPDATFHNHKDDKVYGRAWSWKYFISNDCRNYVKCMICDVALSFHSGTSPLNIYLKSNKNY